MSDLDLEKSYQNKLVYWSKFTNVITKKCRNCDHIIFPVGTTSSLPITPIYGNDEECCFCKKNEIIKDNLKPSLKKLKMTTPLIERDYVYKALDSERDYQEQTAKKWNHQGTPSLEAELLMMEHYLQLAREKWSTSSNKTEVLDILRKVSGISIRCFENYGVPFRTLQ